MFVYSLLLACSAPETQSLDFTAGGSQSQADMETEPEAGANADTGTADEEPVEEDLADEGGDSGEADGPDAAPDEESGEAPGSTEPRDYGVCGNQPPSPNIGDCAENFTLQDETGALVSLHDFIGDVIFIDLSSFT